MDNAIFNPQLSNLQTQLQQLQSLMQKPAVQQAAPAPVPHTILEVNGEEGARQYHKTMLPNTKEAVFDKNDQVFFALAVDANGVLQPIYRCPYTMEPLPEPGSSVVTKQDFEALRQEMREALAALKKEATEA